MSEKLGQYFTTDVGLKEKLYSFILNNPKRILEPSSGRGDLVEFISEKMETAVEFDMFEIDDSIEFLDSIDIEKICFQDFLEADIPRKYDTIVGNPPFVRTKSGNLYIDFTEKCFNLLKPKGEIVFIIPSDFFRLTSACKLLGEMMAAGNFTHIYRPNNEKLFKDASIDVVVFRYAKDSSLDRKTIYNGETKYAKNTEGLVTFHDTPGTKLEYFKDYFEIYVGIVSGKDQVFKNDIGNIEVLNGNKKKDTYICLRKFPSDNKEINEHLLSHKEELLSRKIRKFNETNWFEWGALRNVSIVEENIGKPCIFIHNLTRKKEVAFLGKVGYFGGGLLMLLPKKDCDLRKVVLFLNSNSFQNNFIYSGRFKIGQRQLVNSYLEISHV